MGVSFEPVEQALASLREALDPPPRNSRERDGAIQRFEYTIELAWKTAQRALKELGVDAQSPKAVIRAMARQAWIDDAETWLDFLAARNATSHLYREETAAKVFAQVETFAARCGDLIMDIKKALT